MKSDFLDHELLWKQIPLINKILYKENKIIDTNVVIDMIYGGIYPVMLSLPYIFQIPSAQYDELNKQLPDLPNMGLQIIAPSIEYDMHYNTLCQKSNNSISPNDLQCLSMAKIKLCTLLTGDKALRNAAVAEGVEVHGTIWIVAKMLEFNFIDVSTARKFLDKTEEKNRRLPRNKFEEMLAKYPTPMEVVLYPHIKL